MRIATKFALVGFFTTVVMAGSLHAEKSGDDVRVDMMKAMKLPKTKAEAVKLEAIADKKGYIACLNALFPTRPDIVAKEPKPKKPIVGAESRFKCLGMAQGVAMETFNGAAMEALEEVTNKAMKDATGIEGSSSDGR